VEQLPLTTEVRRGNHIDCSLGGAFARGWRLGIFSLASIAPGKVQNKVGQVEKVLGV
jgi:hypothetical protein